MFSAKEDVTVKLKDMPKQDGIGKKEEQVNLRQKYIS